jgi:hypothetical protein
MRERDLQSVNLIQACQPTKMPKRPIQNVGFENSRMHYDRLHKSSAFINILWIMLTPYAAASLLVSLSYMHKVEICLRIVYYVSSGVDVVNRLYNRSQHT